jgi:hypothetical protein
MSENSHFCAPPCVKDKDSNRMSLGIAPKTGLKRPAYPQRRPTCRGNARGFGFHPNVLQNLLDVGAECDERL